MNRATTSLPVPDAPVTSTVVSVAATCVALRSTPPPFDRLADDAQVGARRQLIDPSLHARVGPLRTRASSVWCVVLPSVRHCAPSPR